MGVVRHHIQNVQQQYIVTRGAMEAKVEKLVFNVRSSSSSADSSSSCTGSCSTADVECFSSDNKHKNKAYTIVQQRSYNRVSVQDYRAVRRNEQ
jgi:hypothetical protein